MSEEFCRSRALKLLAEVGFAAPPVEVEKVAESLGLAVRYVSRGSGFDGRLLRERMVVEVESSPHSHRRRFTIAHEIAHYVLGHDPSVSISSERSNRDPRRINDRQANQFASELLLPEPLVRAEWPKLRNCREMARLFDVSEEAIFYQLERLDLLGLDPGR